MNQKLKKCAYCEQMRPIFKNTEKGPQCLYCYRRNPKSIKKIKKIGKNKQVMTSIEQVDTKFSLLIRSMKKVRSGSGFIVQCFTCDEFVPFSLSQCGHYISRSHLCTRFLMDNCRPQCKQCNEVLHGNLEVFKERLEKEAPGITEKLEMLKHRICSYSSVDLEEMKDNIHRETIRQNKQNVS